MGKAQMRTPRWKERDNRKRGKTLRRITLKIAL